MTALLKRSQRFLLFWLALIAGMAIGKNLNVPWLTLGWLLMLWVAVLSSGHEKWTELTAVTAVGVLGGLAIWQLTGGETWLQLGWLHWLGDKLAALRTLLADRIFAVLPEPHGSLLSGILLGNRVKLDKNLIQEFRLVGLSHVIAVSGYNLTILTANLQSSLRPILPRNVVLLILTLVIVGFVLLSGAPASILRAAVMAGLLLVAEAVGRPSRLINILIIATGILAIFEPKIVFDIGFQLSVAATYGLIRLTPLMTSLVARTRLPVVLVNVISETLSATLMTAPILIIYFERLSLGSPLVNLLVLPLIPLLMGLGLIGSAVLLLIPPLGQLITWLTWPLLEWVLRVSHWFASLPFVATTIHWPIGVGVAVTLAVIAGVEYGNWAHQRALELAEKEYPLVNSAHFLRK